MENNKEIVFEKAGSAVCRPLKDLKAPGPNQVAVDVVLTLISTGTERDYLSAQPNTRKTFPVNAGYSSVGYVSALGSKVDNLKVGDRVFVRYGGHSSYCVKDRRFVLRIPDGVPFEHAVFTAVASFPLAAIRRARIELGESVVVVGLGLLGQFAVQFARLSGANPLIAIGNRDIRKELARDFGADYVFDSRTPNLKGEVMEITRRHNITRGANVVIETSGSESGLQTALTYTAKHARVMLNGCNREMREPTDFYKYVHLRGVQIIGVHGQTRMLHNSAPGNWTAYRDYHTVLQFLASGRINAGRLISRVENPEDASTVYNELLENRDFPMGVLFKWRDYEVKGIGG